MTRGDQMLNHTSGASKEGEANGAPDATRSRYSVSRAKQPCGTYAAARRHERRSETLCEPCAEARRTYHRERARLAYSIPAFRQRENARTAARLATYRRNPEWRARDNEARDRRRRRAAEAARYDQKHLIDVVVVARLMAGLSVDHNRAERLEAVRQLRNHGHGYGYIAERIGIAERQVHRDLADLGLTRQEAVA